MGTVLSISPMLGKKSFLDEADESKRMSLSKPRVIVSTLAFKLFKQKSAKKVNPHPLVLQTNHVGEDVKKCAPQSDKTKTRGTAPSQKPEGTKSPISKQASSHFLTSPVRVVVEASTSDLLLCLGKFMRRRCLKIVDLTPNEVIAWFRNVDRILLQQGWQEQGFITPSILVFVYLLCRETVSEDIDSPGELHGIFLTCLYLTYSYLGNEISYPLMPFIIDANKDVFWQQALGVIEKLSSEMLRINMDPHFFIQLFQELKNEGELKDRNDLDR